MCLSLAPHVLIASAPRAYRSWPSSLSLAGRLLIARGVIDNAKVLHLGRALSDFVRFHRFFFSYILHLTSYFPLFFPRFEDDVTAWLCSRLIAVFTFPEEALPLYWSPPYRGTEI